MSLDISGGFEGQHYAIATLRTGLEHAMADRGQASDGTQRQLRKRRRSEALGWQDRAFVQQCLS